MDIEFPNALTHDQLTAWADENGLQPMQFGAHSENTMSIMKDGVPHVLAVYHRHGKRWFLVNGQYMENTLTVSRNTHDQSVVLDNWDSDHFTHSFRSYAETVQHFYVLELYNSGIDDAPYSLWWNWRPNEDYAPYVLEDGDGTDYIGETRIPHDATPDDIRAAFETLWQRLADQLNLTLA